MGNGSCDGTAGVAVIDAGPPADPDTCRRLEADGISLGVAPGIAIEQGATVCLAGILGFRRSFAHGPGPNATPARCPRVVTQGHKCVILRSDCASTRARKQPPGPASRARMVRPATLSGDAANVNDASDTTGSGGRMAGPAHGWQALRATIRRRFRILRHNANAWLRARPRLRRWLRATGCLDMRPEGLARGVAIGLFAGLTPIVGFQTAVILLACLLLRANFPAAFTVSWISNPLTVAPLYWGFHEIGRVIFQHIPLFSSDQVYMQGLGDEMVFAGLGGVVIATPCAVLGYLLANRLALLFRTPRS